MRKLKKISLWLLTLAIAMGFLNASVVEARYGDNGIIKGKVRKAGDYKKAGSFKSGRRLIFINGEWRKNKRLRNAKVKLLSGGKSTVLDKDTTDRLGRYKFSSLDRDKNYYVKASKDGYRSQTKGKIKLRGKNTKRINGVNFYLRKD